MTEPRQTNTHAILTSCLDAADGFLENAFKQFRDAFIDQMERFNALVKQSVLSGPEDESLSPEKRLCAAWTRIDDWLDQLKDWTDFTAYPQLRETSDSECRDGLDRMIVSLPRTLELIWEADFFSPAPDDSTWIRIYKGFRRGRRFLRLMPLRFANLFLKQKKEPPQERHILVLHNFLRFHFFLPYNDLISSLTDRLLDHISGHLLTVHESVCSHTEGFLGLDKEKADWNRGIHDSVRAMASAVDPLLLDVRSLAEGLDSVWAEFGTSVASFRESFEYSWNHAHGFSGTLVLPHRRYGQRRFRKAQIRRTRLFAQNQQLWARHYLGEGRDMTHDIALCRIQIQVARKTFETLGSVTGKIDTQILPQCEHAIETLKKTRDRLGTLGNAGEWQLKKNMIHESRSLIRNFRRELLPAIANRVLGSGISQDLDAISRLARDKADHLSETHMVFKKRDTHIPPRSELAEIPIRELFNEEFLVHLKAMLDTFQQNLRVRLDDTINGMTEIRQIVEFNLESSFSLLDKEDYTEEAYRMVVEGIDRSIKQLTNLMDQIRSLPGGIGEELGGVAYEWMSRIQRIMDNEKLIALKLKLAKAKATGRLKKVVDHLAMRGAQRTEILKAQALKTWEKAQERYLEIRSYLGFSLPDEETTIQFTQFLLETGQKLKVLPFVYQQLFQIEPLTDDRLFQGREAEWKTLKDELATLDKTGGFLCAVVGEKGSGKTTLINLVKPELPKTHALHSLDIRGTLHGPGDLLEQFSLLRPETPFSSMDELSAFLVSDRYRCAVIVENIQNLFVKNIDGFDLLEAFLELLNQTRSHVAWICSCTLYSWEYLDKTVGISSPFNRIISLKPFSGDEIESMILTRHRITGYQLKFLLPRNIRLSRAYRKLSTEAERQGHLRKIFFDQIQAVACGNISVAILFWLRSIEQIHEHELHLSSQVEFNVKFLSHLSIEERFTLGSIVQHDSLAIDDHALIFRQPAQKSRLTLQNLTRMGLLQQDEDLFRIHPFLYRHVVRSLKLQNILH